MSERSSDRGGEAPGGDGEAKTESAEGEKSFKLCSAQNFKSSEVKTSRRWGLEALSDMVIGLLSLELE